MGKSQYKSHVTQAINKLVAFNVEGDYEAVIKSTEKVVRQAKKMLEFYPVANQPEPVKATPKRPKRAKGTETPATRYKNDAKVKNRRFVATDINGDIRPYKKALIMPSVGMLDVAQFYIMGIFNKDTELICIDENQKVMQGWERDFGTTLRKAFTEHREFRSAKISDMVGVHPHKFIHGKIGVEEGDSKYIDLAGIDGIDFVWLDFTGALSISICEWIKDVLKWKTTALAMVNVTANAENKRGKWSTPMREEKRMLVNELYENDLVPDEILFYILDELDEKSYQVRYMDNLLINRALDFGNEFFGEWYRRSQMSENMVDGKINVACDVEGYTGNKIPMVTHKFQRGYCSTTLWSVPLFDEKALESADEVIANSDIEKAIKEFLENDEFDKSDPNHQAIAKAFVLEEIRSARDYFRRVEEDDWD